MRVNYVFLVPLIILNVPSAALFGQGILVILVLVVIGLAGTLSRNSRAVSVTSSALLGLIVWGRIASDIWGLGGFDTALLLAQFFLVILLMEASNVVVLFDSTNRQLQGRDDSLSSESRARLTGWVSNQLLSLGKLIAAAFALSLSLLVVGDLVSVSFNQIVFSAILVLVAVAALLVLVTYGREPQERERPRTESLSSHIS